MRAVGYKHSLPIENAESLLDIEIDKPAPQGRDLLVAGEGDLGQSGRHQGAQARRSEGRRAAKVLGYDATGVVAAVGPGVTLFKPGDEVWYAGSIVRPGTNSEFHLVDERIVGAKPKSLDFAAAAALPLTSITAWEVLFDRFGIARGGGEGKSLLIVGGAGGVGSIAIQLARTLTRLTVIATASRPETQSWCRELGAHHVIDHSKPMPEQVKAIGHRFVDYIFGVTESGEHFDAIAEIDRAAGQVRPDRRPEVARCRQAQGQERLAALGGDVHALDLPDRRHGRAAQAAERGRPHGRRRHDPHHGRRRISAAINAANLRRAHAMIESGRTRGKIVLEGF